MIEIIEPSELSLLVRLLIAHLLTDFVFQKDTWVRDRFERGWSSQFLYLHGVMAGLMVYLLSAQWSSVWLPVVVAGTHIVIDGVKANKEDNILMFLLDQTGHMIVLLLVWLLLVGLSAGEMAVLVRYFTEDVSLWIIIFAYIIIIWPAGILIGKATAQWRKAVEEEGDKGLEKAGLWIGRLERILILTFVLLSQYQAIGLLVAGKSIFRFSEARKEGEYVLIGTLISFVIAIIVGLITDSLIG